MGYRHVVSWHLAISAFLLGFSLLSGRTQGATIDGVNLWPGPNPSDPFEISSGVIVDSHSSLASGSNITDMFGQYNSTVEAGNTLFRFAGTNSVTFQTPNPIWMEGWRVWLNEDGFRRIDSFQFFVGTSPTSLTQVANVSFASPFDVHYGDLAVRVTDYFEPRYAQYFRATVISRSGTSFGARVQEIEAIVPEPSSAAVALVGLLALVRRTRRGRLRGAD